MKLMFNIIMIFIITGFLLINPASSHAQSKGPGGSKFYSTPDPENNTLHRTKKKKYSAGGANLPYPYANIGGVVGLKNKIGFDLSSRCASLGFSFARGSREALEACEDSEDTQQQVQMLSMNNNNRQNNILADPITENSTIIDSCLDSWSAIKTMSPNCCRLKDTISGNRMARSTEINNYCNTIDLSEDCRGHFSSKRRIDENSCCKIYQNYKGKLGVVPGFSGFVSNPDNRNFYAKIESACM